MRKGNERGAATLTPRCGKVTQVTIGSVVLLPATPDSSVSSGDPRVSETDRRTVAAELMAYGVNVHCVPQTPATEEVLDPRSATAHWVAHIAMNLGEAQPERPILLVAYGAGGPMLPALGFSQKASRRPVAGYVVVDDELPRAGSADWPDAPITYIRTSDEFRDHAHQAELRGWTVEATDDVSATLRTIVDDS